MEREKRERILAIDVLRGFAIFGIFLVNITTFHTPYLYAGDPLFINTKLEFVIFAFVDIFIQASFYSLFAFLFGYSFMLIKEKIGDGRPFYQLALRRMVILFGIGFIHAFFIWSGDILITYALIGIVLIPLLQLRTTLLKRIAFLLYVFPNVMILFLMWGMVKSGGVDESIHINATNIKEITAIYQAGSFYEITEQRFHVWYMETGRLFVIILLLILPLMLYGASLAKEKRFHPSEENNHFWKKVFVYTFPFGLMIKHYPFLLHRNFVIDYVQDIVGGVLLSFSYIACGYFICSKPNGEKRLNYIGNVGKMSLSNYLLQSLICSLLFYGYGLGLYGKVSYVVSISIVCLIYGLQIKFSHIWLKYFYFGPVEWVWRGLTSKDFVKNKK